MSRHSNSLQKWISKSEGDKIESLIGELERKYPLEVVIALTDRPALVPVAAARMIALLAVVAELLSEAFWLPLPAWLLGLAVFVFLLAPIGQWQAMALFRILSRSSERHDAVRSQAEQCFSDYGLARTRARNALLLFFNVKERIFLLQPDRTLQQEWPELKIEEIANDLKNQLASQKSPAAAATAMLERVSSLALARWPESTSSASSDELSNALVWWDEVKCEILT
ncbi:MAG: hypothetical protein RIR26_2588 [Pseudomonadota bacterium]|jgi:uncharacterized membrane protein